MRDENFWAQPRQEMFQAIGSGPEGLSAAAAAGRLATAGPNSTLRHVRRDLAARIARRLAEPLIAILLVAAAVSGVTGDLPGFLVIIAIVLVSVAMDVAQEGRAEAAVRALQSSVALHARARRDGAWRQVPVEALVPGDVVQLAPGNLVPADGVVLEANSLQVNEAALTGEPYPVAKTPGETEAAALFSGSAVVCGGGSMLVLRTGPATRLGRIAGTLAARRPVPAFERGLHALGVLILRATAFLVLFVLLAHLAFHRPPLESFLFAVALAVGLTPELLPMVTTVTLSRGALRMAKRQVVVKRLAAIHDLGAMSVLCTDKTGTLTEARIALAATIGADGQPDPALLALAAANAGFAAGQPSPMDAAILAASSGPPAGWQRQSELPFDFERRRSAVVAVTPEGRRLLVVKGAPEAVLACCAAPPPGAAAQLEARAAEGLRLIAVATRELAPEEAVADPSAERGLTYRGACAFLDPPKPSAGEAIRRMAAQGIRVKVLSGDAAPVLRHVVQQLGLTPGRVLTGEEVGDMPDAQLRALATEVDLYARLTPDQKRRVILALRRAGQTVGFLGDGINDAPAIRAADVGISVDDATEVARAAADLILLAPDLGVLADGVMEGRRTYANVMKYVRMGISSNFGNMLSMAIASVAIPFLPLLPAQVLLNNLLYDLSELGIPFDNVAEEALARPHGWEMGEVLRFMLVLGPLSSVFDIATFALLRWAEMPPESFRAAWFLESMATQILVIFVIRGMGRGWRPGRPHPVLLATSLGALAIAFFLTLGPLAGLLGFGPVPAPILAAILALTLVYLAAAMLAKPLAAR